MKRITLIRHGETEWNKLGKKVGKADVPLNDKGREQVEKLANKLKNLDVDVIYSSPLIRAKDTAKAISKINFKSPKIKINKYLEEIDCGSMEGKTLSEINKTYPGVSSSRHPEFRRTEGLKTIPAYKEELDRFLTKNIYQKKDSDIFIVSHHVILVLVLELLGQPISNIDTGEYISVEI